MTERLNKMARIKFPCDKTRCEFPVIVRQESHDSINGELVESCDERDVYKIYDLGIGLYYVKTITEKEYYLLICSNHKQPKGYSLSVSAEKKQRLLKDIEELEDILFDWTDEDDIVKKGGKKMSESINNREDIDLFDLEPETDLECMLRNLRIYNNKCLEELLGDCCNEWALPVHIKRSFLWFIKNENGFKIPPIEKLCHNGITQFPTVDDEFKFKLETETRYCSKLLSELLMQWEKSRNSVLTINSVSKILKKEISWLESREEEILKVYKTGRCKHCGSAVTHETVKNRGGYYFYDCAKCG